MTGDRLRRIRWAVRLVLILGVAASVAANVLHARPNLISQTISAWPPLALLLTIELISRVPVHRRDLAAVRVLATFTIAGIAAYVSFWHMCATATRYGETGAAPFLLPLSVDGLIVVASVSLVELAGRIRVVESDLPDTTQDGALTVEVTPVALPPSGPVSEQLTAVLDAPVVPPSEPAPTAEAPAVPRTRKAAATSTPKRPFELTQQAAASMEAGGMGVPQIAVALGITERQVRNALRPVPVSNG